ncbi:MAG TPA: hypothetical protein PKA63_05530 [Oligoflexia bacterium]|nr:hypothetical protein [Oligoflexia bacterium]HMP48110.1 hypothetical protein [Oligoflexia bacterium]
MASGPNIFGVVHVSSSGRYTREMLKSFFSHTLLETLDKFYIVDNDSSLDSFFPEGLESLYPLINRITVDRPRSFAENANGFLNHALECGGNLFLLNNDLIFSPGWLSPLKIEANAILSPVCNMQYRYSVDNFSLDLSMTFDQYLGNETKFLEIADAHQKKVKGLKLAHSFPYYCVKIPNPVLKSVGHFDERFSPYGWEDTDYTVRACIKGVPLFFQTGSFILHFYGKSTWGVGDIPLSEAKKGDADCEKKFIEKWGSRITKLFAYHSPDALGEIEAMLTNARFQAFQMYIKDSLSSANQKSG